MKKKIIFPIMILSLIMSCTATAFAGFSDVLNDDMPDLMITKYSILPKGYIEGNQVDVKPITNNVISESMDLTNNKHETFTIRVYFEWFEGTKNNETMNDEADTAVATNNESLDIEAKISFKQKLA